MKKETGNFSSYFNTYMLILGESKQFHDGQNTWKIRNNKINERWLLKTKYNQWVQFMCKSSFPWKLLYKKEELKDTYVIIFFYRVHEFQVFLFFFQLSHFLLTFLQFLLSDWQFFSEPGILLTKPSHLCFQFLLFSFNSAEVTTKCHHYLAGNIQNNLKPIIDTNKHLLVILLRLINVTA